MDIFAFYTNYIYKGFKKLDNDIKIFKGIIPENACESIIQEGLTYKQQVAGVGDNNKISRGRSTTVAFMDNDFLKSYIYQLVFANYDTEITEIEDLQFATYNTGDYYGRHKDTGDENERVLSVTVQLSDPSKYEGGELVFDNTKPMEDAQGTVIIFPSNLYHRVNPVLSGTRYSLVQWYNG